MTASWRSSVPGPAVEHANLGLLTVAALLPDSFEITYVDQTFEAIPERGFTYVLLSPSTAHAPEAYRIADHYRRRGSRVLMGGPHVTVCPEEAARHADTVFVGESEELLPLFFREEQQGRAQKIYRARQGIHLWNPLLFPEYDLAVKYPYKSVPIQLSRVSPSVPVLPVFQNLRKDWSAENAGTGQAGDCSDSYPLEAAFLIFYRR